jgi:hypothetical protein
MKYLLTRASLTLIFAFLTTSTIAHAESKNLPNKSGKTQVKTNSKAVSPAVKVDSSESEDGYVAVSSTHIDFSETAIDGKMKAPDGFLLQSRQSSSLSQMVKLRSNFRNELNNAKSATKAIVK